MKPWALVKAWARESPSGDPAPKTPISAPSACPPPTPTVSPEVSLHRCQQLRSAQPWGMGKRAKLSFLRVPGLVAHTVWAGRSSHEELICPLPCGTTLSPGPWAAPSPPPGCAYPTQAYPLADGLIPGGVFFSSVVCVQVAMSSLSWGELQEMPRRGILGWPGPFHPRAAAGDRSQDRVCVPWGHPMATVGVNGP